MKTIFTIIAFITISLGFSQNGELTGHITERDGIGFPGLTVELIKDGQSFSITTTDYDGKYSFKNIPNGIYSIKINSVASWQMKEETVENIAIENQIKVVDSIYLQPCVASKKFCPQGHSDKIIPIVYGYPSNKMMEKAKKGKIRLGGCEPSLCKKWFCTEHKLEF